MDTPDYTPADFTPVYLVDRAGTGGFEFMFGGRPWRWDTGQTELLTVEAVAAYVFRTTRLHGWTKDNEDFCCRVATKVPNDNLITKYGPHTADTSPIELASRWPLQEGGVEGWDAPLRRPEEIRNIRPHIRPESERQGTTYAPARIR